MELNVIARRCLDRRISDADALAREIAVWERESNNAKVVARWQFTTNDARIKLRNRRRTIQLQ